MKPSTKIFFVCSFFLSILLLSAIPAQSLPAPEEVVFSLRSEDMTTQTGQVRRVYFNLQKGAKAVPVSVTTSLEYEPGLFRPVEKADIFPAAGLGNKTISSNLEDSDQGIIRIGVGVEDYNDQPLLPNALSGDLFYVDFRVLSGANLQTDSIEFNNTNLGPNQASTKEADALRVVTSAGAVLDNGSSVGNWGGSGSSSGQSCFINSLR